MSMLNNLLENNVSWSDKMVKADPGYFKRLVKIQKPHYLWIGCSDSRIPANQVVGLEPGEIFVHRNVANLCQHTDFNCLSVLQYAIDFLKIEHVIVCGHYGCGGVCAAMDEKQCGLVDNWLRAIKDVYCHSKKELEAISDFNERYARLVELNVKQQVLNVCHTSVVQNAWQRGQPLFVHGWVYDLATGRIKDLNCSVVKPEQVVDIYRYS